MVGAVSDAVRRQEPKPEQKKELEKYLGKEKFDSTSVNDYENALLGFFDRP